MEARAFNVSGWASNMTMSKLISWVSVLSAPSAVTSPAVLAVLGSPSSWFSQLLSSCIWRRPLLEGVTVNWSVDSPVLSEMLVCSCSVRASTAPPP